MCHTKVEGTRSKRLFVVSSLRGIKRPTYNPPPPKKKKYTHTIRKYFPVFWGIGVTWPKVATCFSLKKIVKSNALKIEIWVEKSHFSWKQKTHYKSYFQNTTYIYKYNFKE